MDIKLSCLMTIGWVDGRVLNPVCRNPNDPHRVSDELLRWHFRQSVFVNMRGAGEPIFEHDPGGDTIWEISQETYVFRANRGPRPSTDGLVSVDGLGNGGPSTDSADGLVSPNKMKTFWVIKYLNIYSTNK